MEISCSQASASQASAISRGCFASKGRRSRLELKNYLDMDEDDVAAAESVLPPADNPDALFGQGKWLAMRLATLQTLLDRLARDGESKLKKELHLKVFDAVVAFVETQAARMRKEKEGAGSIPTGAVVLGVNLTDHQLAMKTLKEKIEDKISPYIVTLNSNNCGNVRNTMVNLVSQLINNESLPSSQASSLDTTNEDEDDEDVGTAVGAKRRKTSLCTLPVLTAWYKETVPDRAPVVVVFEDLERFDSGVLERLIVSCSGHHGSEGVPFVFIFSIATSVTTVHQLLSHSVSSLLAIQTFQSPLAVDYLSALIDQTLLAPDFPFKLGPKIFAFLREVFHYHDFSVSNFVASLQVCLIEHFLGNPISYFCCEKNDVVKRVQRLGKEDIGAIKAIPSFKEYLESANEETRSALALDSPFRGFLQSKILQLHDRHRDFLAAVRLLFVLGRNLPRRPFGQRLHALYETHLKLDAKECPVYAHAMQLLRMLGKEELTGKLEAVVKEVADEKLESSKLVAELTEKLLDFVRRLVDVDNEKEEEAETRASSSPFVPSTKTVKPGVKKGLKLHELKASLQTQMAAKTPSLSRFEKIRKETLDVLDDFFRTTVLSPKSQIFHEAIYFDRHHHLRAILNPAPRASISRALALPQLYLQCECCKGGVEDKNRILATYPDVSVAYKLHQECPRYINLYDWLQAFVQVVRVGHEDGNEEKDEADGKKPDPVLQARFIRAVSELQFLGFIGPTTKKTDHVIRLTWGS